MPQIQVIGREAVDSQNNQAQQLQAQQDSIQNASYKAGILKYYADELKTKAQISQDETQREIYKTKATKVQQFSNYISDLIKTKNPDTIQRGLLAYYSANQQDVQDFMGDARWKKVQDAFTGMQKSGEDRIMEGVADKLYPTQNTSTNPLSPDNTRDATIAGANQSTANVVGGGIPGQGQTSQSGNGMELAGMDVGPFKFEDYGAQARGAAMKTTATAQATKDVEMEPIKASVGNYLQTFDNAVGEMGGLETNALSALAKGKVAEISAQVGNMPNVFVLSKLIEPVSLQLGSWLNKGRPTDKDQAAAKDTLTRITYTKGANEILRNYLTTIINTGDETIGWKVWNALRTGDTKIFTNPTKATERFIIRENK